MDEPEQNIEEVAPPANYAAALKETLLVFESLGTLEHDVRSAADLCIGCLNQGHKLLVCGNGGSASDAQHLVGELMGRYTKNRPSFPAIALNADSTVLTCIGNDYRFEEVFSRQIEGLAQPGDVLIVFSTSGESPNVLQALQTARTLSLKSIAFLGREGGAARSMADCTLLVAHRSTARIQEAHQFLLHSLMDCIEAEVNRG